MRQPLDEGREGQRVVAVSADAAWSVDPGVAREEVGEVLAEHLARAGHELRDAVQALVAQRGGGEADLAGEELMEKWRRDGFPVVPMNRLATTDDIAGAFLYLASDDAKYVSGANLVVDGALSAQVYDVPET